MVKNLYYICNYNYNIIVNFNKFNVMKQLIYINKIFIIALFLSILVGTTNKLFSQCQPYIKIDGNKVLANQTVAAGLALPYWLKENQTLAVDQMVNSISVIEFNVVNGN